MEGCTNGGADKPTLLVEKLRFFLNKDDSKIEEQTNINNFRTSELNKQIIIA